MKSTIMCDLPSWVGAAPEGERELREAVHVLLIAITGDEKLREIMVMKGGILMALRYQSQRFTKDADFSTSLKGGELNLEEIVEKLRQGLAIAVELTDYDLDCRVQSAKVIPTNRPDASFPNFKIGIGYAYKGTPKHERLIRKGSPDKLSIDFSLNEQILNVENLEVGDGAILRAYAFEDIVAEKLRSLLQQEERNRYRRQDVYDLKLLLEDGLSEEQKERVLMSLREKAASRGIEVGPDSLAEEEIRRRAKANYPTLSAEIEGPLPDFDEAYDQIEVVYRSLPWQALGSSDP